MNRKFSSGVSQAIDSTLYYNLNNKKLINDHEKSRFFIRVANDRESREMAFKMSYDCYLKKGFVDENQSKMLILPYDIYSNTIILIVEDQYKRPVGTVSLVFESYQQELPLNSIFKSDIMKLKAKGFKLVEISRLVVAEDHRNSKEILLLLFNFLMIHSYFNMNYDVLVVQVNPRHKLYYEHLLSFESIGEVRPCPSVKGAPAVLLHLPLSICRTKLSQIQSKNMPNTKIKDRSLYKYFMSIDLEMQAAQLLLDQINPMSEADQFYFGMKDESLPVLEYLV